MTKRFKPTPPTQRVILNLFQDLNNKKHSFFDGLIITFFCFLLNLVTLRFRAQWPLHKAKQLKTKMEKPLKDFSSEGVPLEHYGRNDEFLLLCLLQF